VNASSYGRPATLAVCLAASVLIALPVAAQDVKRADPEPKPEVQILLLRHVRADEMVKVLKKIAPDVTVAAYERSNALIVTGLGQRVEKAQALVAKLDTPDADNAAAEPETRIFPLQGIEIDKGLEDSLRLIYSSPAVGNFAVDRQRKLVIASGRENTLKLVAKLLTDLEQAARAPLTVDVRVRVVWLVSGVTREDAPPPPDDLKEILPSLAKLGIDKPRLAAQAVVNAAAGARFQTKGTARLDTACQFAVTGRLGTGKGPAGMEVSIQATRERDRERAPETICDLQTEVSTPPGHLVLLGVTPTGSTTSVFVVQVLPPEPKPVVPKK
jgi:hypothetical protein